MNTLPALLCSYEYDVSNDQFKLSLTRISNSAASSDMCITQVSRASYCIVNGFFTTAGLVTNVFG